MSRRTMQLIWMIFGAVWLILAMLPFMPADDCVTRSFVCLAAACVMGVRA